MLPSSACAPRWLAGAAFTQTVLCDQRANPYVSLLRDRRFFFDHSRIPEVPQERSRWARPRSVSSTTEST